MATILVADDDSMCRSSMQMVLEREGYNVESTPDVDAALAAIGRRDFDLIICDYRMPGKTGLDLLTELNERHVRTPVLMVSAFADKETEAAATKLGALGLLKKPFRRQELIDQTANAIRH